MENLNLTVAAAVFCAAASAGTLIALAAKQYALQYDPTAVTGTDCGTDPSGATCNVETTQ